MGYATTQYWLDYYTRMSQDLVHDIEHVPQRTRQLQAELARMQAQAAALEAERVRLEAHLQAAQRAEVAWTRLAAERSKTANTIDLWFEAADTKVLRMRGEARRYVAALLNARPFAHALAMLGGARLDFRGIPAIRNSIRYAVNAARALAAGLPAVQVDQYKREVLESSDQAERDRACLAEVLPSARVPPLTDAELGYSVPRLAQTRGEMARVEAALNEFERSTS